MFAKTHKSYGVNEVLLASVLGSVVFSLFAAQPLVIVGVTGKHPLHQWLNHADGCSGPITVFNYTVYDIVVPNAISYFPFMCWIGIWSLVMHWILAITNACNGLTYVTRFSCDIFGFYVAFIYLQKGIQVLTRQWSLAGETSAFVAVMVSLLVLGFGYGCGIIGESSLFQRHVRKFIEDYGTPLTIVFFTGFVHFGHMKSVPVETLPTSKAFFPTMDRSWFIDFWKISVGDIFLAIPFAILLTILFYFDHNGTCLPTIAPFLPPADQYSTVSSLIAQGSEFPLRKPPGFHWDIFLLGLTTGVAGLLGIPFPNGLIPQAPFHTTSLCVTRQEIDDTDETNKGKTTRVVDHVVEQRVSNLAQGLLTLGTMSGPLLVVLHLIPQGVLAGLFFLMGTQALAGNGITQKLLFLARDRQLTRTTSPDSDALARLQRRRSAVWAFVALQLVGFGATFAITQTVAAIGFPVIILALIPVRTFLMPRWFWPEELNALDAPTAGAFVMESVGGAYGEDTTPTTTSDVPTPAEEDEMKKQESGTGEENESGSIEDTLERGESYELRSQGELQRPDRMKRRRTRDIREE